MSIENIKIKKLTDDQHLVTFKLKISPIFHLSIFDGKYDFMQFSLRKCANSNLNLKGSKHIPKCTQVLLQFSKQETTISFFSSLHFLLIWIIDQLTLLCLYKYHLTLWMNFSPTINWNTFGPWKYSFLSYQICSSWHWNFPYYS